MKKYTIVGSLLLTILLLSSCNGEREMKDEVRMDGKHSERVEGKHSKKMEGDKKMMGKESGSIDKMKGEWTDEEMKKMNMEEEKMMGEHSGDMKKEDTSMIKIEGSYEIYSNELVSSAKGNTVLFFSASWCPSCKTADKNLSSENIPEGLNILKVDYDSNLDLRKKYGVTSQHTFVLVNNKGEEIKKWSGSKNSKSILEKIK